MLFTEMKLKPSILGAIKKMGYETATPIQQEVITHFISWQHIVWQSQTGTGKTAAFVIPTLDAIDPTKRVVQALVLCPTRELAVQTEEEFYKLSWWTIGIRTCVAYWWSNIFRQKEKIMQWAQVVIATPWRAIDLIQRWFLKLHNVQYLILDEADRMLDMWFSEDVEYIRSHCTNIKQIMSFSATVTHELKDMLTKYIGSDYHHIVITPEVVSQKIDHMFIMVPWDQKIEMLAKYLSEHDQQKILIFTQTKIGTDELVDKLTDMGIDAFAIHGDIKQRDRNNTIKAFKENKAKILVATDVASRGLNLNQIDLVLNRDVPQDPEAYVHRIGRTGRAWADGKAITLVTREEMKYIHAIEKRNKITIKEVDVHGNELERPKHTSMSHKTFGKSFGSRNGRSGFGRWWDRGGRWWDRGYSSQRGWSRSESPWYRRQERINSGDTSPKWRDGAPETRSFERSDARPSRWFSKPWWRDWFSKPSWERLSRDGNRSYSWSSSRRSDSQSFPTREFDRSDARPSRSGTRNSYGWSSSSWERWSRDWNKSFGWSRWFSKSWPRSWWRSWSGRPSSRRSSWSFGSPDYNPRG